MGKCIVFWQNIPSFHQSAHIRALAAMPDCDVILAVQEELPRSLQDCGWTSPDFGKTRLVCPQNDADIRTLILDAGQSAVHIFSGIRFPMVRKAFLAAVKTNACLALLAESPDWRGTKGFLRYILYRAELLRFRSKIDFILAIGHLGLRWYSRCGFPPDKIYPFGYFVEKPAAEFKFPAPAPDGFCLVFTGQFINRKGIDILIAALNGLREMKWRLDIVGDGQEREDLMRQVAHAGLSDRILFHGAMKNPEARRIIAQADLLVLPSRWDGWGAVVNEALMLGVPVVCSDACGAADLLGSPDRGEVFKAGSVAALENVLERWIRNGKRSRETIECIKSWSKSIEGEMVAQYLLDVIDAAAGMKDKPLVPWLIGGQMCALHR